MSAASCWWRTACAGDLSALVDLLEGCGLPADDLAPDSLAHFELAVDEAERIVGVAGFDRASADALLRSLAVAPDWRGRGLGEQLVARREAAAQARSEEPAGVNRLFLLTTSAADYFLRLGYHEVPRADVPAEIAAHAQFRSLCPASARCLSRRL